jgi:glycosyltransferase involved in cell wall biosynthesis
MSQPSPSLPRPLVAIIANVQTPYRLHVHRRIARELPEIRIASLYTHSHPDQPWNSDFDPIINPVQFGQGEGAEEQGRSGHLREWRKGGRIVRWLREHNVAAVVLGGYSDMARVRIISACHRLGIPCYLYGDSNIHGDRAAGVLRRVKNTLLQWVVRSTSGVLPCGTLGAQYFARYGAKPDHTFFFPCEPDYELIWSLSDEAIESARQRFGLARQRRRVVVCARLVTWKRVDLVIDAFAAIASERPDWDLVIVGDGPERQALEERGREKIPGRMIWTGFVGDQSVVSAVYRASDVLVCPSDYEPWAVVINEAVAAGMAIVASNVVGAAAELVVEDVNGSIFPAGSLSHLTESLRWVTGPENIERLKAGSDPVLADWRRRGDPVDGLRRALGFAGVLQPTGPPSEASVAKAR